MSEMTSHYLWVLISFELIQVCSLSSGSLSFACQLELLPSPPYMENLHPENSLCRRARFNIMRAPIWGLYIPQLVTGIEYTTEDYE